MALKLFFKHLNGYLNINDEWIAFTSNGNWSEIGELPLDHRYAMKKLRLKRIRATIGIGILLMVFFFYLTMAGVEVLGNNTSTIVLTALSAILAIVFNHHYNTLQGIRIKIPNDSNVGFHFEDQTLLISFIDQYGNLEAIKVTRLSYESIDQINRMIDDKVLQPSENLNQPS